MNFDWAYLEIALTAMAAPIILLAVVAIVRFRLRRRIALEMREPGPEAESERPPTKPRQDPGQRPLHTRWVRFDAAHTALEGSAAAAFNDARLAGRAVDRAHLIAGLAFTILLVAVAASSLVLGAVAEQLVVAFTLSFAPLFVTLAFLALSWPWRLAILTAYGFIGLLILAPFAGGWTRTATLAAIWAPLVLSILPCLLLLAIRRLRPLLMLLGALCVFIVSLPAAGIPLMLLLDLSSSEEQILTDMRGAAPWVWIVATLNFLGGAVLLQRLLHLPRSPRALARLFGLAIGIIAAAAYLSVGPLKDHPVAALVIAAAFIGPVACTLQWFVAWLVFRLFVRIQELHWLTTRVLHFHLCCAFLTLFVAAPLSSSGEHVAVLLCLAAFCVEVLILHLLLRREWVRMKPRPAKRLLLLRVFGQSDQREKLLDWLDDGWRHVGRVDLIAGTDLAMRTLGSRMLEAFLLRRTDSEYLETTEDVSRRLSHMHSELEGDLRYPVNEVYCYENTWKLAVGQLALNAHAVLMDLRGFSRANLGCVFELEYLIREVPISRVLLIADQTTDATAVEETLSRDWHSLPGESPDLRQQHGEIVIMKLAGHSRTDKVAMNRRLYQIAFGTRT